MTLQAQQLERHARPQVHITVYTGDPLELHLWGGEDQREGQAVVNVGAHIRVEDDPLCMRQSATSSILGQKPT
jgi:hypothetical protein